MSADAPAALQVGARAAAVSPMAATAQTGADVAAAGLTEIAAFTGGTALPPRTGTMVTMGSRPLSGTSVTPHVSKPHDYVNHMFMRL
jgi:hypothetical protein